jgi:hypothetical protein
MLLKLTLSGLQSPALLHSFTIPENSEPSLLFQGFSDQMTFNLRPIAAPRLFEPALDGGPATKKAHRTQTSRRCSTLPIDPDRKGHAEIPSYFGYHSSNRTSIPVPSNRFWNTLKSEPR